MVVLLARLFQPSFSYGQCHGHISIFYVSFFASCCIICNPPDSTLLTCRKVFFDDAMSDLSLSRILVFQVINITRCSIMPWTLIFHFPAVQKGLFPCDMPGFISNTCLRIFIFLLVPEHLEMQTVNDVHLQNFFLVRFHKSFAHTQDGKCLFWSLHSFSHAIDLKSWWTATSKCPNQRWKNQSWKLQHPSLADT